MSDDRDNLVLMVTLSRKIQDEIRSLNKLMEIIPDAIESVDVWDEELTADTVLTTLEAALTRLHDAEQSLLRLKLDLDS
jgi:hypothetical protein